MGSLGDMGSAGLRFAKQNNSKIVVYDAGTSTIVAQEASNVTGTFSASINVSSVDIILLNLSYEVIKLKNVDTTVDREIPIQQRTDRQYENP